MSALDSEFATEYGLAMDYAMLGAFTYTQQAEDFEELVLSLKVGEYSEPVVRGDGILIAHRLELSDSYVEENFDDVVDAYKEREFARLVQEKADSMEIVFKSEYKSLKLWEME